MWIDLQGKAYPIPAGEVKFLKAKGVLRLANKRTLAIVQAHVRRDSRISWIAQDCYLQGIRDAAEATGKA